MSSEPLYIKNIENAIRAIRLGNKTPEQVEVSNQFVKLKNINVGMHDELMAKYKRVVADYNLNKAKTK